MPPSPTIKDGDRCFWSSDLELMYYVPDPFVPTKPERIDNLNRMLCPVSPFDFMEHGLDDKFRRHYLET